MGLQSRPTYWAISKELGVQPGVVKRELEQLENSVVKKVRVVPEVGAFGLKRTQVYAQIDDRVRNAIPEKLRLFDFVESVYLAQPFLTRGEFERYVRPSGGYHARIDVVGAPGMTIANNLELMKAVVGDFAVIDSSQQARPGSEASESSASVLRELMRQPFAEIAAMADRLGLTPKTVARHLRLLEEANAFHFEPLLSASKSSAFVFAIAVQERMSAEGTSARLKERLRDYWLMEGPAAPGTSIVLCIANNYGDMLDAYSAAEKDGSYRGTSLLLGPEAYDNQPNVQYLHR